MTAIQFDLTDSDSYYDYFLDICTRNKKLGASQFLFGDIEVGQNDAAVWKGKKLWADFQPNTDHALMARELEGMMLTLELKGGVRFRRTIDKLETARFVAGLYHWWTVKGFDAHRSHLRFHSVLADKNLLVPPSYCRLVAAQLPGIGFEKSTAVALHFGSVSAMVQASESAWMGIKGIGKALAGQIVEALQVAGKRP